MRTPRSGIRGATLEDSAALSALSRELDYPISEAESGTRLDAILRSEDHAVLAACSPTGAVVAWVPVFLSSRIESEPFAELGGFVRQGHGRRLLAASRSSAYPVESIVTTRGHFTRGWGFSSTKEQRIFGKPVGGAT